MVRVLVFVLPLGLDAFAVAAALGAAGVAGPRDRLRVSLIFVAFETGMPLIGLAAGGGVARAVGGVADYLAAAAVIGLGILMLVRRDRDDEQAGRIAMTSGMAVIALGVSISMDEFAMGLSIGLLRLPAAPVIGAIAVQALIASQLGLAVGQRVSAAFRERAEQLAAAVLIGLGGYLLAERALAG